MAAKGILKQLLKMNNASNMTTERTKKIFRWRLFRHVSINHVLSSIWPYRLIRIILAFVFLWSGLAKLFEPRSFALILAAYGIVPESWIMPVAVCLPTIEVIAAVGLLLDIRGSLSVIAGLLLLFMAILFYGIWLGLDIDCGCFAPGDPESNAYHGLRSALYRDVLMMAGVSYLFLWRYRWSAKLTRLNNLIRLYPKKEE